MLDKTISCDVYGQNSKGADIGSYDVCKD